MSWKSPEASTSSQNHVNQVLTCKVCEQAFSSLKDLSEHMVKNNHYKQDAGEQASRSQSTSPRGAPPALPQQQPPQQPQSTGPQGQQQQSKEKRKKSLPVRKLLELERAQQELSGQIKPSDPTGRIACEKCGEKILMHLFVDHIRGCVGPSLLNKVSAASMADLSRLLTQSAAAAQAQHAQARTPSVSPDTKKTPTSPTSPSVGGPAPVKSEESVGVPMGPKSILGSLEKMVADNFGAKKKVPDNHMSILQRLGIDEGVDYNKPLMDPMAMFRSPSQMAAAVAAFVPFSSAASTTTRSNSSECSSPDRFRASAEPRPNSAKSAASPAPPEAEVPLAASVPVVKKVAASAASIKSSLEVENEPENEGGNLSKRRRRTRSNSSQPPPRKEAASEAEEDAEEAAKSEHNSRPSSKSSEVNEPIDKLATPGDSNKKAVHPLAELQMLCDSQKKSSSSGQSGTSVTSSTSMAGMGPSCTDPGAILAFSWACNQAVVNDSLLKCPFCDTPFISKGAYRHHLSKMHFVKDGGMLSAAAEKVKTTAAQAAQHLSAAQVNSGAAAGLSGNSTSSVDKEENAQSKFQKYSQLAKQLSCGSSQP